MSEKQKKIERWISITGKPAAEFEKKIDELTATYAKARPNESAEKHLGYAIRKINMDLARELASRARPADFIYLGASSAYDTTRDEIAEKKALWANEQTRDQAVAEGKVSRGLKDSQGEPIPDGTPLDTRQWFVAPNPSTGEKGRKNPNFGKPLKQSFLKTVVGFGKPISGGVLKLMNISANNEQATRELPPIGSTYRARLNLKDDTDPYVYYANTSRHTEYYPVEMAEFPDLDTDKICALLSGAPEAINPGLKGLMDWMERYGDNKQRLVIFEGDVKYLAPEPNDNGSRMIVLIDGETDDPTAEGITGFIPEDTLGGQLDFGPGSRVVGVARPNLGDAWDREERRPDPTRKVVNLAVDAIFAVPFLRVAPEEATMTESE